MGGTLASSPDDGAEDRVLVVEVLAGLVRDEELRARRVGPRVGHAQDAPAVVTHARLELVLDLAAPEALPAATGACGVAALLAEDDKPSRMSCRHGVVRPDGKKGQEATIPKQDLEADLMATQHGLRCDEITVRVSTERADAWIPETASQGSPGPRRSASKLS